MIGILRMFGMFAFKRLAKRYTRMRARPCNQQTIRPCIALPNQKIYPKRLLQFLPLHNAQLRI